MMKNILLLIFTFSLITLSGFAQKKIIKSSISDNIEAAFRYTTFDLYGFKKDSLTKPSTEQEAKTPARAQAKTPIAPTALADSMLVHPKPILFLIANDWCKYCGMQKALLKNHHEFQSAKETFYHVILNAEKTEPISFNGKIYGSLSNGPKTGVHELAIALGDPKEGLSYPTWVLFDQKYRIVFRRSGVLLPKELKLVLSAIKELNTNPLP
ncbi:hypothetical protein DBR43_03570 [Pedobacter sp. KBW06]|uniref:hypothetical protein n=1 Tax=Pedobacter sp. KBW06 TaxID=2153359 RepID=UPI000F59F8DC|nr:hypothetical protein [Pedobacter sp. KBW06]RQO74483.1 hypothetical protein DBR43_03570 [Pedobacter sp. KBW06]